MKTTFKKITPLGMRFVVVPLSKKITDLKGISKYILSDYLRKNNFSKGWAGVNELISSFGGYNQINNIASHIAFSNEDRFIFCENNKELTSVELRDIYSYILKLLSTKN